MKATNKELLFSSQQQHLVQSIFVHLQESGCEKTKTIFPNSMVQSETAQMKQMSSGLELGPPVTHKTYSRLRQQKCFRLNNLFHTNKVVQPSEITHTTAQKVTRHYLSDIHTNMTHYEDTRRLRIQTVMYQTYSDSSKLSLFYTFMNSKYTYRIISQKHIPVQYNEMKASNR